MVLGPLGEVGEGDVVVGGTLRLGCEEIGGAVVVVVAVVGVECISRRYVVGGRREDAGELAVEVEDFDDVA